MLAEQKTLPAFLHNIPQNIQEQQQELLEQLKSVIAKKFDPHNDNAPVSSEFVSRPPHTYVKSTLIKKRAISVANKPTIIPSNDLDELLKEIEKEAPQALQIIEELEHLTAKSFEQADFDSNATSKEDFLTIVGSINSKNNQLYRLCKSATKTDIDDPAFSRLHAFVATMHESNTSLTKKNNKLNRNASFTQYKVCIESLHATLTKLAQPQS